MKTIFFSFFNTAKKAPKMYVNSNLFQPFPVCNSKCFTQKDIYSKGRKKYLRPKLVFTVLPEANEKEIIVQRVPLVIEYLQNNWILHGWQPKKNVGADKKTTNDGNNSHTASSSQQPWENERENGKNNRKSEQRERVFVEEHSLSETFVNSRASVGLEEVADKLRQSALHQSSTAKRRHLSLAEQAMENEAETEANVQSVAASHSQSVNFCKTLVDSVGKMSDDHKTNCDGAEVGTPPPKKHGRKG